jgi:PAN domain
MFLLSIAVVSTLLSSTCGFLPIFCPIMSPIGKMAYITDQPSRNVTSQTMLQCAFECAFSQQRSTVMCQSFNYNSTAMTCNLFSVLPAKSTIDESQLTIGYQVTDEIFIVSIRVGSP